MFLVSVGHYQGVCFSKSLGLGDQGQEGTSRKYFVMVTVSKHDPKSISLCEEARRRSPGFDHQKSGKIKTPWWFPTEA